MEAAAAAAKEQQRLQQTFLRAASMGLLADVEQLVAQGVSVAAVVRRAGGARLRRAADVPSSRRQDEERAGALHLAAARDHAAVISFLLSHGADADAEDAAGRTGAPAATRDVRLRPFPERPTR